MRGRNVIESLSLEVNVAVSGAEKRVKGCLRDWSWKMTTRVVRVVKRRTRESLKYEELRLEVTLHCWLSL